MPKTKNSQTLLLEKLRKIDSKGKFFLFIAMFAAVSGCYLVYRGFAEQFLK